MMSEKLAVIIGNTNTSVALISKTCNRIGMHPSHSPQYNRFVDSMLALAKKKGLETGIASVVPSCLKIWKTKARKTGIQLRVLNASNSGLKLMYDSPGNLGADRIAGVLGAASKFPNENCFVADFGTAITLNAVSSNRIFLGGLIMPGIDLGLESLSSGTQLLPKTSFKDTKGSLGRNTKDCILLGCSYQAAGGIALAVQKIAKNLKWKRYRLLVTGGGWSNVKKYFPIPCSHEPDLVLCGIGAWMELQFK